MKTTHTFTRVKGNYEYTVEFQVNYHYVDNGEPDRPNGGWEELSRDIVSVIKDKEGEEFKADKEDIEWLTVEMENEPIN